jgi:hypothetical protein
MHLRPLAKPIVLARRAHTLYVHIARALTPIPPKPYTRHPFPTTKHPSTPPTPTRDLRSGPERRTLPAHMCPRAESELQRIAASVASRINWQLKYRLLLNPKRLFAGYLLHHAILHAQEQPEEFLQDINLRQDINAIIDEVSIPCP